VDVKLYQINSYVRHWLNKVDEHSIHSPYFFDFYNRVILESSATTSPFAAIEEVRSRLLKNNTPLHIDDIGAPSDYFNSKERTIARVAQTSLNPASFSRFLFRLVHHINAVNIIELGTSMGLTTLYLSLRTGSRVVTFEGSRPLINIALTHFEFFEKKNIKLVEGNIDITLPDFLQNPAKIDFVFIDANHRYEPTVRYFTLLLKRMADKGVIVVHDIYRSEEMEKAWREISRHELVYASVDLYQCGILFFDPALNRQHYTWSL
jgi:predicted O-methyltransferase YrrM